MMPRGKDVIALITARGGSKRLPGKNIKYLAGKPLIAWTIECALKSKNVRRVLVSTDDAAIARIARRYGAEVPFMRPRHLAQDHSTHVTVANHALEWLKREEGRYPDYLLLLQPTSPFRSVQDIDAAIHLAYRKKAPAVVAVHEMPVHPFLARTITRSGVLKKMIRDGLTYRRKQALPVVYAPNGALYLTRPSVLRRDKTFFPNQTYPHIMSPERSADVDTARDFFLAELILKNSGKKPR